jgi:hypothetical protein
MSTLDVEKRVDFIVFACYRDVLRSYKHFATYDRSAYKNLCRPKCRIFDILIRLQKFKLTIKLSTNPEYLFFNEHLFSSS